DSFREFCTSSSGLERVQSRLHAESPEGKLMTQDVLYQALKGTIWPEYYQNANGSMFMNTVLDSKSPLVLAMKLTGFAGTRWIPIDEVQETQLRQEMDEFVERCPGF